MSCGNNAVLPVTLPYCYLTLLFIVECLNSTFEVAARKCVSACRPAPAALNGSLVCVRWLHVLTLSVVVGLLLLLLTDVSVCRFLSSSSSVQCVTCSSFTSPARTAKSSGRTGGTVLQTDTCRLANRQLSVFLSSSITTWSLETRHRPMMATTAANYHRYLLCYCLTNKINLVSPYLGSLMTMRSSTYRC